MRKHYAIQPGRQQQVVLQREAEIICLSGRLHISMPPHMLGDSLVTGQRTVGTGQGFRAYAAGRVTLDTDQATRYTIKMTA
jgi:hypothetical protein